MPAKTKPDVASPVMTDLDKAKGALVAMKALCPDLSILATVLAGRDPDVTRGPNARLNVVPGPATCTDGTTIYLRPDARMAGTPTEKEWSEIKAGLFHEIAHVVFDSFRVTTESERAAALRMVTDKMEDSYRRDALLRMIAEAGDSYMALAKVWHPLFPFLINALEDARVEALLFIAKPGTHKHLEASRMTIFDAPKEEIEALIGTAWIDRDRDSQVIIGTYILGAGYAPEGRLIPEVCTALRKVEPYVLAATTADSVEGVYAAAFDVLSNLQRLGFLRNGDERDEPMGETPHDESEGGFGGMAGDDATGCAHPKAYVVECSAPSCKGNCTLCGAHIVSKPTPDSEGESGDGEGESGDGKADAPKASAGAPRKASDGGSEGEHDKTHGEGVDPASAEATAAAIAADDGSENVGTAAGKAEVEKGAFREDAEGDRLRAEADERAAREARREAEREAEKLAADLHKGLHAAGGHDGRESDDKALDDDALDKALTLDEYGYGEEDLVACVTKITVTEPGKGHMQTGAADLTAYIDKAECERAIATVMPEMRQALAVNGRTGFTPHQRSGRVDTRALYKTATGATRVFGRYTTPATRDYFFVIALDCSGSMGGDRSHAMKMQKALAYAEAEMLDRLGIPFIMYGYSGDSSAGDRYGYGWHMMITPIRDENQPWDDKARERLSRLNSYAANLDGSSMQYARIRGRNATRNPRTEVVVLYHNDGGMPAENPAAEGKQIKQEVRDQRKNNVHFVGVGLGNDSAGRAGLDLVLCHGVEDIRKVTAKIAESMGVRA